MRFSVNTGLMRHSL